MRSWPNAEFWALWARAGVVIALAAWFIAAHPVRAESMRASFYGAESGRLAANGSRFNPMGFTAASKTLPFGTRLQVCFRACAVVTVTDRGPYVAGRSLDLARGAARAIGLEAVGVGTIDVVALGRGPGRAMHARRFASRAPLRRRWRRH